MVLLSSVPKEVEELHSTFTALQAVLEDAEGRRVNDKSVILWLEKLKDLAYDVEDILDEWRTEALRSQADEEDGSRSILNKVSSSSDSVMLRHNIGTRIKEAKQRLDDIAKVTGQLGLNVDSTVRQGIDSEIRSLERRERETSSLVDASSIVGRTRDVNELMCLLMGESSQDVFSERKGKRKRSEDEVPIVVSIVGMGGLGKTTLAQLLYNDKNVQQHFEMTMWVCVSEDFDVKRVTKSIIESAARSSCALQDLDTMQQCLREKLHRNRFLLVLDDVWSEECEKCEKLKVPLQAGAPGSRVIITTRSENVASAMGSTHVHKLPALSDDDCWLLFSRRALVHRNVDECLELEYIGKKIAEKCGGIPLAAKAVGSLLRTKNTRREWELLLQSETWSLECGILPALLLSYYDLPSPLKPCFAYCSLFPKDWRIKTDVLAKLWMAQGFISSQRSEDMEEIDGLYIDELVRRSLFQDVKLDDEGNIASFKLHDLVHDLARFVARGECLLVEKGKADVDLRKVRHAAVPSENEIVDASTVGVLCKAEKLRTIVFLYMGFNPQHKIPVILPSNLFDQLRSLRALHLSLINVEELPQIIGKLRHLRHLDLSSTLIVELPETVADLYNLLTLNLYRCRHLRKLPERLGKLINLRHLEFGSTRVLEYMPRGIGRLTALRTVTKLIVGDGQKECGLGELKNLNHLQGKLLIEGLEKVVHMEEAREAELGKKQYLSHLCLEYGGKEKVNGMLESLRPHSNLKLLSIGGYLGFTLPRWIEDPSFSNLVTINLVKCLNCKQLPCLGKLPFLKYLSIRKMEQVRHVGVEFCGADDDDSSSSNFGGGVSFPKLEELAFSNMENWEEWELRGGVVMMPSLFYLSIVKCPKLKALPENLPLQLQRLYLSGVSLFLIDGKLPVFPNLKYLDVSYCFGITSIPGGWLGELKALEELLIWSCTALECLPEEMQHLAKLQRLTIVYCPIIGKRCKMGGEDWHKIAHIPIVKVSDYLERMV